MLNRVWDQAGGIYQLIGNRLLCLGRVLKEIIIVFFLNEREKQKIKDVTIIIIDRNPSQNLIVLDHFRLNRLSINCLVGQYLTVKV